MNPDEWGRAVKALDRGIERVSRAGGNRLWSSDTPGMAFGQPAGPPATARQLQELLALLQAAGHSDFRDARGPMGFNQRQGGGRFTRDEADAFIEQLQSEADADAEADDEARPGADDRSVGESPSARASPNRPPAARLSSNERAIRALPTDQLAAELQRRGWIVIEP